MNGTVLLIDDDKENLDLLSRMLRNRGDLELQIESSSASALALLKEREFDVVVTDIVMPQPDGIDILRYVKDKWPETEVIVLSGVMTLDRALESLKLHAFDFVPKPVHVRKFVSTVSNALDRRRLQKENSRMTRQLQQFNRSLQLLVDEATSELQNKVHLLDILSSNYRAILDQMPSGCLIIDNDGYIYQMNKTAASVLGIDCDKDDCRKPHGCGRLPSEARYGPLRDILKNVEANDSRIKTKIALPCPDGSSTILRVSAGKVTTTGGEHFSVIIFDDITEVFELERRLRHQERLATVGGLAAGIAHEIKNPLGAIRGLGELLSMKIESIVALRKFSDNIMTEVDRLNRIINDIVRFSKDVSPSMQEVDLGKLLQDLAKQYMLQAEKRNILLEIKENIPDIPYDYAHFKQALTNILDNAVQATDENGVITISAGLEGEYFEITVSDNGVGISPENLERIFRPFYSTRKSRGSGLGLTIAEKVVQDHGGKITVTSEENQGTRVTVLLPLPNADAQLVEKRVNTNEGASDG